MARPWEVSVALSLRVVLVVRDEYDQEEDVVLGDEGDGDPWVVGRCEPHDFAGQARSQLWLVERLRHHPNYRYVVCVLPSRGFPYAEAID